MLQNKFYRKRSAWTNQRWWINAFAGALIGICFFTVNTSQADELQSVKVINWNVLYGFNHGQSRTEGSRWISDQEPDIVALQELNGITEKDLLEQAKKWGHAHAVTHKENGFPVGLTSRWPIQVLERKSKGFHHGYLHCKTRDIHFFVVHFWPGKYHEMDSILERVRPLLSENKSVVILGDFNGCSRKDETYLVENATQRERDYIYVDKLEAEHFVDLVSKHDPNAKVSCPSPITIPRWSSDLEDLRTKRYRIDFIFADESFAKRSKSGTILLDQEVEKVSDHYPVMVEFLVSVDGAASADKE